MASLPSATGRGYITVTTSGGAGAGCDQLMSVQAATEAAEGNDPGFDYPFGLVGFTLTDCTSTTITLFLHGADPANPPTVYRKFGPRARDSSCGLRLERRELAQHAIPLSGNPMESR